jgi:hypothetical protein
MGMQYIFLIYTPEDSSPQVGTPEFQRLLEAHTAFTEDMQRRGILRAGDGLRPTTSATTVRVRGGDRTVTDGPFAETREQLGGFYILDCSDLDEAVELAPRIPGVEHGSIEIRPTLEHM